MVSPWLVGFYTPFHAKYERSRRYTIGRSQSSNVKKCIVTTLVFFFFLREEMLGMLNSQGRIHKKSTKALGTRHRGLSNNLNSLENLRSKTKFIPMIRHTEEGATSQSALDIHGHNTDTSFFF
ncbi:unnamed protein product, partial [Ixodes persulcatus]